jgi:hypothetical protein
MALKYISSTTNISTRKVLLLSLTDCRACLLFNQEINPSIDNLLFIALSVDSILWINSVRLN